MKMTKEDIGHFCCNMKATYNESNTPKTQPKPLYGQGHENLETVLSYVPPDRVDNHYDLSGVVYDLTGEHGWEVVLHEKKEKSTLEEYTLALLKDELRRRGIGFPGSTGGGDVKGACVELIEDDIQQTGEDEPDWTSRPPVLIEMETGMEEVLRQELEDDVREANAAKTRKNATPTIATGWSKCKHGSTCWQGNECGSEDECYLFECYYCTFSECGVCAGLSARQSSYVGNFICSSCRIIAAEKAVVLSASSLE